MKKPKIVATIEARMNSSRLPGKVMKKINKYPLLEILIKRVMRSKLTDHVVVATTTSKKDDEIVNFLKKKKISFFRGSEKNVTLRVIKAAEKYKADIIVQLTGDNPLIDPKIIDYMIKYFTKEFPKFHFIANNGLGMYSRRTVPWGMDVQIFTYKDLVSNYKKSFKKILREHPSLYFYREGRKFYNLKNLPMPRYWRSNINPRLTVDTPKDLKLIRMIFKKLGKNKNFYFGLKEILNFLKQHKSYLSINNKIKQKKISIRY